jgi:hypothetical protein
LPVRRRRFHHNVVLIEWIVDRRHLALAESVIERIVDLLDREAEPRGGRAIDCNIGFQPIDLQVAIDLRQIRNRLKFSEHPWRPRK